MTKAMFGAGCFWGVEATFRQVDGVLDTAVGFAGGTLKNPTYKQACGGQTGHAEVIALEFDSDKVSYEQLLDVFWSCHDPTTLNRQGPDIGTQYRSVIFYFDEAQQATAESSQRALEEKRRFTRPITTKIVSASTFYKADEHHQRYFEKQGISQCRV